MFQCPLLAGCSEWNAYSFFPVVCRVAVYSRYERYDDVHVAPLVHHRHEIERNAVVSYIVQRLRILHVEVEIVSVHFARVALRPKARAACRAPAVVCRLLRMRPSHLE